MPHHGRAGHLRHDDRSERSQLHEQKAQYSDPGYIQRLLQGLMTTFEDIASPTGIDGDENGKYDHAYWEDSLGVTHRQSSNLQRCLEHLDDFLTQTQPQSQTPMPSSSRQFAHKLSETDMDMDMDIDIVTAAEHLRSAADTMAKITGRGESGDVEDVLGVVFEK